MPLTLPGSALAMEIHDTLKSLGRGSRQGHRPSAQDDFGVYTQDLRAVVRTFNKRLKTLSGDELFQLGVELLGFNNTECRQTAYELIAAHRAARELLDDDRIEILARGLDNWACVDNFCITLVGEAWRTERIQDSTIEAWSRSQDQWRRRAALVATVPLNLTTHGGRGDSRRTLHICTILVADQSDTVQKALSWALRCLVPWDRPAVKQFIIDHEAELPTRVKRELRRKLETGKKN